MIFKNKQELTRFLRFAFVGLVGAVIDFGIFNLLSKFAGLNANVAQAISFSCAVVSNFIWNRYWTYPDSRTKALHHQLVQFILISVIGLGIRTPLFAFLHTALARLFTRVLPPQFFVSPEFVGYNLALAIAIVVVMLWNFFANRYWTYNDVDKAPSETAPDQL